MTKMCPTSNEQTPIAQNGRSGIWSLDFGRSLVIGHWSLVIFLLLSALHSSAADEFDSLRLKWRDTLTLGTNASKADTNYFAWISSVESNSQSFWGSMNTNAGRTNLWSKFNQLSTVSSDITGTYGRLKAMALGYSVHGSSNENNAALRGALISGLDWMYTNYYNETISQYTNANNNWFDWEIATPLSLNDITALIYTNLSASQIANYMNAIDHFTPNPSTVVNGSLPATGANEVWKASIVV